jgi:hypothetical protein
MPMPLRLTIAMLMSDIGTEWTLNRALLKSSDWSASSQRRTLGLTLENSGKSIEVYGGHKN